MELDKMRQKKEQTKTQFNLNKYYFIVGIISLIAVFGLPLFGSNPTLGLNLPSTFLGWLIYIITKLCVAIINMSLFHCFMRQGKLNIKDDPRYLEACEILNRYDMGPANEVPIGPDEWEMREYKTKGVMICITTLLSAVVLTQAVLVFDWISMLTYLFTIIMGVIMGLFQQDNAEDYWTGMFYRYAKKVEKEMEEKANQEQVIKEANNANNQ